LAKHRKPESPSGTPPPAPRHRREAGPRHRRTAALTRHRRSSQTMAAYRLTLMAAGAVLVATALLLVLVDFAIAAPTGPTR